MATIRELKDRIELLKSQWRSRENGYDEMQQAKQALLQAGEEIRLRLPFKTYIGYAYSPRENVGSGGGNHILTEEAFSIGRISRTKDRALCQPASKTFWGMTNRIDKQEADCLKCLEIAERLCGK